MKKENIPMKYRFSVLLFVIASITVLFCGCTPDAPYTPDASDDTATVLGDIKTPPKGVKTEGSPKLEISEIMIQNSLTIADRNGNYLPWIEIHNISTNTVDLSEYSLKYGDNKSDLPEKEIEPGDYFVVFVNGTDVDLELDKSGILSLFHGELLTHRVGYSNTSANHSFVVAEKSENFQPTPGYDTAKDRDLLMISEVMSKNSLYPVDGELCGFVELYNYGSESIELGNYYITDSQSFIYRCKLPDVTLSAGEYFILKDSDLAFPIAIEGATLLLTRNDGVMSAYLTYPELTKNVSYLDTMELCTKPTPGFENSEEGSAAYLSSRSGPLINEVISSNTKFVKTDGDYHDMIELFNSSEETIKLSDYYISDSSKNLNKYQLPEVTLGPGEYYTLIASGKGGEQASFKISQDGEKLFVSNTDGYIIDAVDVPYIPTNNSYGRYNGQFVFIASPSFGSENPFGYTTLSADPAASAESGFYSEPFAITLSGEGTVYYTTDGSKPSKSSKQYRGEQININGTTSVRAICCDGDKIPSRDMTFNYFLNMPDLTLPVVKVTITDEAMYGANGVYTNYNTKKEAEAHVAMYVDGNEEFSVNCGIKVFGAYSRRFAKKSYQLKFRAKYGCSKLKYDVFGDGEITEFNSLVLRSGSQDYYRTMMRDEFATSILSDFSTEVMYQKHRPVNVYVNGEYLGVYYIREKINDDFIASHYDVSPESVTIVNKMMYVDAGSDYSDWKTVWNFAKNNDLSIDENYQYISDHVSIESVIDFYIIMAWSDNRDCGNVRVFRSNENDGKWRFIYFDNDLAFGLYLQKNSSTVDFLFGTYSASDPILNALIYKLFRNSEFKDQFLTRLAEVSKTALSNENVLARLDEFENRIDHDMQLHPKVDGFPGYNSWKNYWMSQLRKYVTDRADKIIDEFSVLLKLSNSEKEHYFGDR